MAEVINMPRLSDTMEEGTVAKWLKKVGDKVEEGDILAEIETDKATMEFESFYDGTLLYIGIKEGESAPVDQLLAIIGEEDENIDDLINKKSDDSDKDDSDKDDSDKDDSDKDDSDKDDSDKDDSDKDDSDKDDSDKDDSDKDDSDKDDSDKDDSDKDDSDKDDSDKDESDSSEENSSSEIPDDVNIVRMPQLSDTMSEGTVASWLKKEGDDVEEGDILAEIETDKATMEFESFYEGKLLHIGIKEGESAPVNDILAIIGPEGTDVSSILKNPKDTSKDSSSQSKKTENNDKKESVSNNKKEEKAESPKSDQKQGTNQGNKRIFVSPLAKKMAEDKGIDLSTVEGSGDNGRIVKRDIENYKPKAESSTKGETASTNVQQAYTPAGEESFEEIKNSQMRKTIAKRLAESKYSAPHYYLTIEVDMDDAMKSRKAINSLPDTKVSYNDLVIKAAAMALRKHPRVNSQWSDNITKIAKHIHVGVAVAVEDGLVVPVLKFADQQSLTQIGANVKEYAQKAHNKKLQPDEMEGSTFTVSNLGMFGIEEFTSIINQPNSAILSVGMIKEKPVVKNGEIVVGHTMKLTMACDHRTVDGATGSKFLQTLKSYIENPVTMLA